MLPFSLVPDDDGGVAVLFPKLSKLNEVGNGLLKSIFAAAALLSSPAPPTMSKNEVLVSNAPQLVFDDGGNDEVDDEADGDDVLDEVSPHMVFWKAMVLGDLVNGGGDVKKSSDPNGLKAKASESPKWSFPLSKKFDGKGLSPVKGSTISKKLACAAWEDMDGLLTLREGDAVRPEMLLVELVAVVLVVSGECGMAPRETGGVLRGDVDDGGVGVVGRVVIEEDDEGGCDGDGDGVD